MRERLSRLASRLLPAVGLALSSGALASAQSLQVVLDGLDTPVFVTSWPDNSNVLVVAERGSGKIVRYLPPTPPPPAIGLSWVVLDLSAKAFIPTHPNGEFIGVTGFAFHPDFNNNRNKRFLYVRYNEDNTTGPPPNNTRMVIERYHIPPGMLEADENSATLVYENDEIIETTHAGGQIHFDTTDDGNPNVTPLYFAIPDNVIASGDCCTKALVQDDFDPALPTTHFGKLFVVDGDRGHLPVDPRDSGGPELRVAMEGGQRNPVGHQCSHVQRCKLLQRPLLWGNGISHLHAPCSGGLERPDRPLP